MWGKVYGGGSMIEWSRGPGKMSIHYGVDASYSEFGDCISAHGHAAFGLSIRLRS
jgi:hypothetical protein